MPLLIGEQEQTLLREAMERARKKPMPLAMVMQNATQIDQNTNVLTLEERRAIPKRDPEVVMIPFGYRVSISWEEQPAGMCLHLSMSSSAPGMVPHPEAIAMVLDALGIKTPFAGRTWIEEFLEDGKKKGHAVNVAVVMDPSQGGHA